MDLHLTPISGADIEIIASWRYDPPYDIYDVDGDDAELMADPAERCFAVRRNGDLIAYACLGAGARVSELDALDGFEDLGVGVRPDLTGHGLSRTLLPWLVSAIAGEIDAGDDLRVVIRDWNVRSLAAYRRTGFVDVDEHRVEEKRYKLLILNVTHHQRRAKEQHHG